MRNPREATSRRVMALYRLRRSVGRFVPARLRDAAASRAGLGDYDPARVAMLRRHYSAWHDKWGFDALNPDMDAVRARWGGSEVLLGVRREAASRGRGDRGRLPRHRERVMDRRRSLRLLALAATVGLLLALAWSLSQSGHHRTGTNGRAPTVALNLPAGAELCQAGEFVERGTGRVRIFPKGVAGPFVVTVSETGGEQVAAGRAARGRDRRRRTSARSARRGSRRDDLRAQ